MKKRSCGCPVDAHPESNNYAAGAAEREGRVCKLGWPVYRRLRPDAGQLQVQPDTTAKRKGPPKSSWQVWPDAECVWCKRRGPGFASVHQVGAGDGDLKFCPECAAAVETALHELKMGHSGDWPPTK